MDMSEADNASDLPETPHGWTGPREWLEAGEKWHTGGGIHTRDAVHPQLGLHIVWNPEHDTIEVGVQRVKQEDEYGTWIPTEKLESVTFADDEAALAALPDLCRRVEDEYGS